MPKKKKPAADPKPSHLSEALAAILREIEQTLVPDTPPAVKEALAIQVKTMRDARRAIEEDGLVVRDAKNNAVEHPALAIERAAAKTIDTINREWAL